MSAYGWIARILALRGGPQHLFERLDGRLGLVLADVRRALEQLGLDVRVAVGRDGLEQLDRLLEVPLLVVELAEQEVELVADLLQRRLIELGAVVLADLLEDAGRVWQLPRQRRQPLQGRVVVGVRRPLLNDAIEVRQRCRVVLHVVEGLAHPEFGLLLVRLAIARLALDDLAELDRRRVVVLAVVELERAFEHLRRLIADAALRPPVALRPLRVLLSSSWPKPHDPERINRPVNRMPIARLGLMRRPRWLCSKARELKGWGERFTTD